MVSQAFRFPPTILSPCLPAKYDHIKAWEYRAIHEPVSSRKNAEFQPDPPARLTEIKAKSEDEDYGLQITQKLLAHVPKQIRLFVKQRGALGLCRRHNGNRQAQHEENRIVHLSLLCARVS
jgi:hypothetical protein